MINFNFFRERKMHRSRLLVNPMATATIITGGKVLTPGIKAPQSSHSRVLSKRYEYIFNLNA